MINEPTVKRWTAKRKVAVVMDIFKSKTTVAEVARVNDLTVSEVESWIEEVQRSMENGFGSRPRDIREQYEAERRESREALRSLIYKPTVRRRKVNAGLVAWVKKTLERFPTYGYRRLAYVLGENRKPIQRILQLKGWQVRQRAKGVRPRAKSLP